MILGLAMAQDQNYRNYQQDDGQQSDRRPVSTTPIPILHWNKQQEHDGTYKTRYNHIYFLHNFEKKLIFKIIIVIMTASLVKMF